MSSPVSLTAGNVTALSMNVTRGSGFDYTIFGRLLCDGVGIAGKQVAVKVNGTVVGAVTTLSDGSYSATLHLPAANSQITDYQVEAIFYGDDALNLTGLATLPNGTEYVVCTTLQYFGYKPASTVIWLTIELQSTQVMQQTKTPEQLQQEAEQCLSVWHEFSWWYPWYRLHLVLNVSLPQGRLQMDYGWTLLPFGQTFHTETPEVMAAVFNDLATNIAWPIAESHLVGKLAQHAAALLMGKTLVGVVIAVATYVSFSILETIHFCLVTGDDPNAWLAAFVVSAISGTFGLFEAGLRELAGLLTAVGRQILGKITSIMNSFWARGLDFLDITGIAFSLIDFACMVFYLTQYINLAE